MPTAQAARTRDPIAELEKELAQLEKHIGKGLIHPASAAPPVYHLPFLNPHLNYATEGGVPWNRFTAMYGDESTGKTLAALELVAQAQQLPRSAELVLSPRIKWHRERGHMETVETLMDEMSWIEEHFPDGARCLWHDIEGQFDKKRAAKVGVDIDALWMSESDVIEDIGFVLPWGYKFFHLQVLDSTSAAKSNLSLKQEPGKSLVGTDARQWKSVLRDSQTLFGPSKNTSGIPNAVILIHQMSTNVRSGGAQPMTTKYLKHTSSCSIRFQRGQFLWDVAGVLVPDKPAKIDEHSMAGFAEADGIEVFAKIEKSRTCRPFRAASMQFDYRSLRYTPIHELAASGIYFGVINKSGSWYAVDGEEENIGQGLKTVYGRLAEDGDLRERIMCRLMDISDEA